MWHDSFASIGTRFRIGPFLIRLFLAGIAAASTTLLFAQAPKRNANRGIPPAPDQAAVDRGQKLFGQNCSFCHGKDANGGDGGPDLIRSVLVNHDENGNLFAPVVHNGSPEKGMPKFSLTPALPQSEHTRKTVTVTLKSGQTLSVPLQHVDEFTISLYDAAGYFSMEWSGRGDAYEPTRELIEASLKNLS
jgi:hypothetical protein